MLEIESPEAFKKWLYQLPTSPMVYPQAFSQRLKYFFWRFITPIHPYVRDFLTFLGILRHNFRQEYLIGLVAPGESLKKLVLYLIDRGYGTYSIAWRDSGELASLRYVNTFTHQYHIRIFNDGEVRAHYEYTPEYHPALHMLEIGMVSAREYFVELLGDRIIPAPTSK